MNIVLSITGSRDVPDRNITLNKSIWYINYLRAKGYNVIQINSGGARGVDSIAVEIANILNIPFKLFKADWALGKQAGMLRNKEMADATQHALVFWDEESKGTEHYINYIGRATIFSLKQNKFIFNKRYFSFGGYFRFLSNMYVPEKPLVIEGKEFRTTEHYYQYKKVDTPEFYEIITKLNSPGKVKRVVNKMINEKEVRLRSNWQDIKFNVMLNASKVKYRDKELLTKLKSIDGEIVEYNYWNDKFWGKGIYDKEGLNYLGKILMRIRDGRV